MEGPSKTAASNGHQAAPKEQDCRSTEKIATTVLRTQIRSNWKCDFPHVNSDLLRDQPDSPDPRQQLKENEEEF